MSEDLNSLRIEARNSLKSNWFDSFVLSLKFLFGTVGICSVVGGGVIALSFFDKVWMVALTLICFSVWTFSLLILELERHRKRSKLLEQVISMEKNYEILLNDARIERDDLKSQMMKLKLDIEVVRSANVIVNAVGNSVAAASANAT